MRPRASRVILLLAIVLAAPAAADWLVMRDGTRVETAGAWEVKGRQVIFTSPDGALAALRLADVDLEASDRANATSQEPAGSDGSESVAKPADSESRGASQRPVRVFTNDSLGLRGEGEEEDDAGEEAGEAAGQDDDEAASEEDRPAATTATGPVKLISWRERESAAVDGLEIVGSVRNTGDGVAAGILVRVRIPDEDGGQLADIQAFLQRSNLGPGQTSNFRALLPGVYALLEEPTFEVTSAEGFSILGSPRSGDSDSDEDLLDEDLLDDEPLDDEGSEQGQGLSSL